MTDTTTITVPGRNIDCTLGQSPNLELRRVNEALLNTLNGMIIYLMIRRRDHGDGGCGNVKWHGGCRRQNYTIHEIQRPGEPEIR